MSTVSKYKTVHLPIRTVLLDLPEFDRLVNEAIDKGWQPIGGPVVVDTENLVQAMVRDTGI